MSEKYGTAPRGNEARREEAVVAERHTMMASDTADTMREDKNIVKQTERYAGIFQLLYAPSAPAKRQQRGERQRCCAVLMRVLFNVHAARRSVLRGRQVRRGNGR